MRTLSSSRATPNVPGSPVDPSSAGAPGRYASPPSETDTASTDSPSRTGTSRKAPFMRFTDGFWQLRAGVEALYAQEAYDLDVADGELRVTAPTKVIARRGEGTRETFTVRRIVQGEGVERVFPLYSPRISRVEVKRTGRVRRAKLYYLRKRVGKATRLRERKKGDATEGRASKAAAQTQA